MRSPLLTVSSLNIHLERGGAFVPIVEELSFDVGAGEMLAIIGESGSGKSLTCLALVGALPRSMRCSGDVLVAGTSVGARPADRSLAMIFQDPIATLNPIRSIGSHLREVLRLRRGLRGIHAREASLDLLNSVGIGDPDVLRLYPHQMSGGMNQRAGIALALAGSPRVLIADEPTTALDLLTQKQILDLLDDLRRRTGLAVLLVTHDLSLVKERADQVLVLYGGHVMERADPASLFTVPRHPYTAALIRSLARLRETRHSLPTIAGRVPQPGEIARGCRFAPRCAYADQLCRELKPVSTQVAHSGCSVACRHPLGGTF